MKKSKSRIALLCTALVLTGALAVSCGLAGACTIVVPEEDTPIVSELTVVSIALDTSGARTEFTYGEEFTAEGLKVTATMSDGSTQDVDLSDCTISKPNMSAAGTRNVTVTYQGKTARYTIEVKDREIPPISEEALIDITGETPSATYRVEAEAIDFETSGASYEIIETDDENVSGGSYIGGLGVVGNYFGFTFTTEYEYSDVSIVLHVANPSTTNVLSLEEAMNIYLNYQGSANTGAIDLHGTVTLDPATVVNNNTDDDEKDDAENEDGDENEDETPDSGDDEETNAIALTAASSVSTDDEVILTWDTRAIKDITLPAGTNTLTFDVLSEDMPLIDYIDVYVGETYVGESTVSITEDTSSVSLDFEDFNVEKVINRSDFKEAYGIKDGEVWLEDPYTNREGTSKGTSAAGFTTGTEISTTLSLDADASIEIFIRASFADDNSSGYWISNNWSFSIDGITLPNVEYKNIKDGSSAAGEYWQWQDTSLGIYNLTAGDHLFTATVTGAFCNVDIFIFDVISYGSFDESGYTLTEEDNTATDSIVEITSDTESVNLDFEDFNVEKVINRDDFKAVYGLKDGEVWLETPSINAEGTSKGTSAAAFTTGTEISTTISLDADATIEIFIRASFADDNSSGYWISDNWSFSIDGITLPDVEYKNIKDGSSAAGEYWQWQDTSLGIYNLSAGDHTFDATLTGAFCNVDIFIFKVISYGSFDESGYTLNEEDNTATDSVVEITSDTESVNLDFEDFNVEKVINRDDFKAAYGISDGEVWLESASTNVEGTSKGTSAAAFTTGTEISTTISLDEDATIEIFIRAAYANDNDEAGYYVINNWSFTIDGITLPNVESKDIKDGSSALGEYWQWQDTSLGVYNLSAGDHTFDATLTGTSVNVDIFIFKVISYGTFDDTGYTLGGEDSSQGDDQEDNGEVTGSVVSITEDTTSVVVEFEDFNLDTIVTREDTMASKGISQGEIYLEDATESTSKGTSATGFTTGTEISTTIVLEEDSTIQITIQAASYDSPYLVSSNWTFYIDGVEITSVETTDIGDNAGFFEWKDVTIGTLNLSAGAHVFTVSLTGTQCNVDTFTFTVVSYGSFDATGTDITAASGEDVD